MDQLRGMTVTELLAFGVDVNEELRRRGILRTSNNPIGDFAEHLFCRAFSWRMVDNSEKEVDAVGADGARYQIKARRLAGNAGDRQLSALRRLPEKRFDKLAAVLFNVRFGVERAVIIPHHLVLTKSIRQDHTNSWRFILRDEAWLWPGVEDATEKLRAALLSSSPDGGALIARSAPVSPQFSLRKAVR